MSQRILLPDLGGDGPIRLDSPPVVRQPDLTPSPKSSQLAVGAIEQAPPPRQFLEGEGPLTLEQAIAAAHRLNPHLQVIQQRIEQARAGKQIAFADFLPEIKAMQRHIQGVPESTTFALPTIPTILGNTAFGGTSDRFDTTEMQIQWALWDFGRTGGKYGQAVSALAIVELTYERARETIAFNVARAYFGLLQASANRIVAEEAVRRAESQLRDARNFHKRGTAVRNDVLRAEVQLAEMRLSLVTTRTAEAVAVASLNQVIGFNVNCPTRIRDLPEEPPFALRLEDCLQLAVSNREEFQVVLRSITSAQYGVDVANADFMPTVYVAGSSVRQTGNNIPNSWLTAAGVGIELHVFQGGKRLGQLRSAKAEVSAAIAQGKEICDRIAYEVDVAYLTMDDARQRIELSRTAVGQAKENLRVVAGLFRQGDATPTDMVDAELTMIRAQQNYYNALYDYQTGFARVLYAMGLPQGGPLPTTCFPDPHRSTIDQRVSSPAPEREFEE